MNRTWSLVVVVWLSVSCPQATASDTPEFFWTDPSGKAQSSRRFSDIPLESMGQAFARVVGSKARSGDRFDVDGIETIRLIGVDAPDSESDTDPELCRIATMELDILVRDRPLVLRFDKDPRDETKDILAYVEDADGRLLNQILLERGLARCAIKPPNVRHEAAFYAAQELAKNEKLGVWHKTVPAGDYDARRFRSGFSLGLFSRQDDFDYRPFLKELVDVGAKDVMLITPWFLETHESLQIKRRPFRTCPLSVVETVALQARELGLRVTLMPIVLITNAPADKWRGNLKPPDLDDWFSGYQEFILPFADVARRAGVEILAIGSELSSLEDNTTHWRSIIRNVRARFPGLLTYSANWDHLDTIRFWKDLDIIGMTGYHSLSDKKEPTVVELVSAWSRIKKQLVTILEAQEMPYFFTEMGYASLDGINQNPWDYVSPKTPDNKEQADCYDAWIQVWRTSPAGFRGAWFYTWWRNNDADDERQYTVHGKPAETVIRRWFREMNETNGESR